MPFDGTTIHEQRTLNDEPVRARLRYARNQITAGKWCQKTLNDDNGNRCLIGWLDGSHTPGLEIAVAAIRKVWRALPKSAQQNGNPITDLARYNDTHTRNAAIKLLNRAIVAMETR